jgi:hypothetical protein
VEEEAAEPEQGFRFEISDNMPTMKLKRIILL